MACLLCTAHTQLAHADEVIRGTPSVQRQHSQVELTPKEKYWLTQHPQITVAVKSGWMPIEFKLENERHRGLSVDYLSSIADVLPISFKVIHYSEDADLSQIDIISGVSGSSVPNAQFKLLKQPFLILPNAIYTSTDVSQAERVNSLDDLKQSRVAVFRNGPLGQKLRDNYPNIKIVYVDIADEAFDYLKTGEIDAYLGNEIVIDYHIAFHRLNFAVKTGLTPFMSEISMAVKADQPELLAIMEKATLLVGQNNTKLIDNWRIDTDSMEAPLKYALLIALAIFLVFLFRFYSLKQKIKQQDAENRQKIWHQANFDYLTKLPNRHLLQNRLEQAITRANKLGSKVGLLFIDLDNFKNVNDSSGHSVGDKLLKEAANRITAKVGADDTTARFGGDEFMVILSDLQDIYGIEQVCKNILESLEKPFVIGSEVFFISASIGITLYPDDERHSEALLSYADQAMYEAKKLGKNRYQFFTEAMQVASNKRLSIIHDLRDALVRDEFVLYFQPIVNLQTHTTLKAEVLIRWQHPQHGLLGPNDFIQLAEESGLIPELGQWVFRQAIADLVVICRALQSDFQLSINVSPFQFAYPEQLLSNMAFLKQKELPGHNICIEITEGILLEPTKKVTETIQKLSDFGIEFSIDDFGTGYSALAYLKKFNIDYVKIDKSFIQNLESDVNDAILCEAIIEMAHKLGIELVAEGVETKAQSAMLSDFKCDYAQGYLFARPQPLQQLLAFLKA